MSVSMASRLSSAAGYPELILPAAQELPDLEKGEGLEKKVNAEEEQPPQGIRARMSRAWTAIKEAWPTAKVQIPLVGILPFIANEFGAPLVQSMYVVKRDNMTVADQLKLDRLNEIVRGIGKDLKFANHANLKLKVSVSAPANAWTISSSWSSEPTVYLGKNWFNNVDLQRSYSGGSPNLKTMKGLLAHEVSHIKLNHLLELTAVVAVWGMANVAVDAYMLRKEDLDKDGYIKEPFSARNLTRIAMRVGLLAGAAAGGFYLMRCNEFQADANAAYDQEHAKGIYDFFDALRGYSHAPTTIFGINVDTHPPHNLRADELATKICKDFPIEGMC